jgi:hypothetical protein
MTNLSKAMQAKIHQIQQQSQKTTEHLTEAYLEVEAYREWIIETAISQGMNPNSPKVSNAKSYIATRNVELATTLDNINSLAKEAGYSSIMNLVKGFRKTGEKRTFEYYCSILPDWATTLSPKFRRWRSDTREHTAVKNFMVRDWCEAVEEWLASSPSETDLNYVQSEWQQVANPADAQKLRSWINDRNEGLPVEYETDIIDIAPEILAFTDYTRRRIGATVIRELAENFQNQKFTLTRKQYSTMPRDKRDLDKFFYLFEQVTGHTLDSEKLEELHRTLHSRELASYHGISDYEISDQVTLDIFTEAVLKNPVSFSMEARQVFVPKEITPENEGSLLACLALLNSDENVWGVVPASAPRPF